MLLTYCAKEQCPPLYHAALARLTYHMGNQVVLGARWHGVTWLLGFWVGR